MRKHNQTERHIINLPMPFTREQLMMLVMQCNNWDEETATPFVDHIIKAGRVDLNPSSALGEGANIVDIFSLGFMTYMKMLSAKIDVDPNILWWHPCSLLRPAKVKSVDIEYEDIEVESNEHVMYHAIEASTGKTVTAEDVAKKCPGNSDNLDAYKS